MSLIFDNGQYTEFYGGGKRGIVTPLNIYYNLAASSSTVLVAGVAGKRIRVLSLLLGSQTATATNALFISSIGPINLQVYNIAGNATAGALYQSDENGLTDTGTSAGLSCNVGAAAAAFVSIKYVIYTP